MNIPCSTYIVDDCKVYHLRVPYKERLFSLNKSKSNLKMYIKKYDFIKQINELTNYCKISMIFFNRKFKLGFENVEKKTV